MKTLYCWRCQDEVPMQDEVEWALLRPVFRDTIGRIKAYRQAHGVELAEARAKVTAGALEIYARITGVQAPSFDALWHHRLALYGPPCGQCGRPLRTPQARLCGGCMAPRSDTPRIGRLTYNDAKGTFMSAPTHRDALIAGIAAGLSPKYVLFWGHTASSSTLGKECLSQWYPAEFEVDGVRYPTAEHWMMAEKARLFEDAATLEKILAAEHPGEAKKLGRKVGGFVREVWDQRRFEIVVNGNLAKFGQNPALQEFLANTAPRVLVEASPHDRIWGIGLGAGDPGAEDPSAWKGANLLGFALMQARAQLSEPG